MFGILALLTLTLTITLTPPSATSVDALYFFLESGSTPKCFIEDLPKETTVIGTFTAAKKSEHDPNRYEEDSNISIDIVVKHIETNHELVSQSGKSKGRFTFTSSDFGQHHICFSSNQNGWFSNSKIKLTLDLLFGDITHDVFSGKKEAVKDITSRVKSLNEQVIAIVREQRYQKSREADFRNTSEATNTKVVHWTIIQVVVLVMTCLWQMRHLRQFFVTKKLL